MPHKPIRINGRYIISTDSSHFTFSKDGVNRQLIHNNPGNVDNHAFLIDGIGYLHFEDGKSFQVTIVGLYGGQFYFKKL